MDGSALPNRLLPALAGLSGLKAIVLGGSRARGTATPGSDWDIGLYYDGALDTDALQRRVREALDPAGEVTPTGGWGPWIDGGGWLKVDGQKVDLLYRDLGKVAAVIEACRAGRIERHYQPGHPHAFVSAIWMGEVAEARILWDPSGTLAALAALTRPYPRALAKAITDSFLWEATFALENARTSLHRPDPAYIAGCLFRSVACLAQVLHALNGRYLLNEKGAVAAASQLPRCPPGFAARVEEALRGGPDGIDMLQALVGEVAALG
jgi:hypothetical protein